MLRIQKLFSRSPLIDFKLHAEKTEECLKYLDDIIVLVSTLWDKDTNQKETMRLLEKAAKKLSKLEFDADKIKNEIRNRVPKKILLPLDKYSLLEMLSLQDSLADKAEKIAIFLSLRPLKDLGKKGNDLFVEYYNKNKQATALLFETIKQFQTLLEASFGGVEAVYLKDQIFQISHVKYQADKLQYKLRKEMYNQGEKFSPPDFHMWVKIVNAIGGLSQLCEKLGNKIGIILDLKH